MPIYTGRRDVENEFLPEENNAQVVETDEEETVQERDERSASASRSKFSKFIIKILRGRRTCPSGRNPKSGTCRCF